MPDTTVQDPVEYSIAEEFVNNTVDDTTATVEQVVPTNSIISSEVEVDEFSRNIANSSNVVDEAASKVIAPAVAAKSHSSPNSNEPGGSDFRRRHRRSTSSGDVSLICKVTTAGSAKEPSSAIDVKFSPEKAIKTPLPSPNTLKKTFKRTIRRIGSVRGAYIQYKEKQSTRRSIRNGKTKATRTRKKTKHLINALMAAVIEQFGFNKQKPRSRSSLIATSSRKSLEIDYKALPAIDIEELPANPFDGQVAAFELKYYLMKTRRAQSDAALWDIKDDIWSKMEGMWQYQGLTNPTFERDDLSFKTVPGLTTDDPIGQVMLTWPPPWLQHLADQEAQPGRGTYLINHPNDNPLLMDDMVIDDDWAGCRPQQGGRFDQPFNYPQKESTQPLEKITDRRLMYLENAINELYETEEAYNRHLYGLSEHYFRLMRISKILTEEQCAIIMRNGKELYEFHQAFIEALKTARMGEEGKGHSWAHTHILNIAKCLKRWAPMFSIYIEFCTGHEEALRLVQELEETDKSFQHSMGQLRQFQRFAFNNPRVTFEDYMHFPFQRICRYNLLITAIAKGLDQSSEEYRILKEAKELFHEVLVQVNENKAKTHAEKKTNLFLSRLEPEWRIPQKWITCLGVCKLIGTLEVRYSLDRWAKRRGCALFKNYLIMVKAKQPGAYEPTHWFSMRYCDIQELPEDKASWILHKGEHKFEMSAACATEKSLWLEALGKTIEEAKHLYSGQYTEVLYERIFVSSLDKQFAEPVKRKEKLPDKVEEKSNRQSVTSSIVTFAPSVKSSNVPSVRNSSASTSNFSIDEAVLTDVNCLDTKPDPSRNHRRLHDSMDDLKAFFVNPPDALPRRPLTSSSGGHKAFEAKFIDVCFTPILKARTNFSAFKSFENKRISLINTANLFKRPSSDILVIPRNVRGSSLQHSRSFNIGECSSSSKGEKKDIQSSQQLAAPVIEAQPRPLSQSRSDTMLTRLASRANSLFKKKQPNGKGKQKHE